LKAPPHPSHLEEAAPFLLTAGVILFVAVFSESIISRICSAYEIILAEYECSVNNNRIEKSLERYRRRLGHQYEHALEEIKVTPDDRTTDVVPENLAKMGTWLIDGGVLITGLMGPVVGLVILFNRVTLPLKIAYVVVIFLIFAMFTLFVNKVEPLGYPKRQSLVIPAVWVFTPVVLLSALVNFAAGILVLVRGP
jgi:hypothetical protein